MPDNTEKPAQRQSRVEAAANACAHEWLKQKREAAKQASRLRQQQQRVASTNPPHGLKQREAPAPAKPHQPKKPPECLPGRSRRDRRARKASKLRHGRERSSYRGELEQRERLATRVEAKWGARMDATERKAFARELRLIPPYVWRTCWAIIADRGGEAARVAWLGRPAVWRAKMMRAALGITGGRARNTFSDLRARRICALAWALTELTWNGATSKKWSGGFVAGVTQGALRHLLRDMEEKNEARAVPTRSALAGVHRADGSIANGQCGYLQALREVDFCYWQCVPGAVALPCERWGTLHKSNRNVELISARYWIASPKVERHAAADPWIPSLLECVVEWVRDKLGAALKRLGLYEPPVVSTA